ncbi:MAG: hypothetical protein RL136_1203 [Planctomycetota bacterium]|jgi:hypothetical protein
MRSRPLDHGSADALSEEPARAGEVVDGFVRDDPECSVRDEPAVAWKGDELRGIAGYDDLLADRLAATPLWMKFLTIALLVVVAGPFGVFGAFWTTLGGGSGAGYFLVIVTGPLIEEVGKVALLLWFAERRPWLLPGGVAIVLTGFAAGAMFGVIENILYLEVYFPDKAAEIAPYRWLATAPMHAIASSIAALGAARVWRDAMTRRLAPRVSLAAPFIVAAVLLHGAFNLAATVLGLAGIIP